MCVASAHRTAVKQSPLPIRNTPSPRQQVAKAKLALTNNGAGEIETWDGTSLKNSGKLICIQLRRVLSGDVLTPACLAGQDEGAG